MKKLQLLGWLTLSSGAFVVFVELAQAQVNRQEPQVNAISTPSPQSPSTEIPHVSDLKPPVTSAAPLLTQEPEQTTVVQVTGIRINPTPAGIEVVLETLTGALPQPITKSEGNTLIADIPNAVLALPEGQTFRADNPANGIKVISVTQTDTNSIRVSITGEAAVPEAQVIPSASGLVLSLTSTAQKPDIDITVTGNPTKYGVPNTATITKTDTPVRDIPFSVQVIGQQVIQDQRALTINEAVRNVSGFALSGMGGARNEFSLLTRGFTADKFRDGFSEGNSANRVFTEISNLDRIEVLKGPAATLYGQAEPGAIVNLVTKQPLPNSYYAADFIAGSYDFYHSNLDLSGPLDGDRNLRYRMRWG